MGSVKDAKALKSAGAGNMAQGLVIGRNSRRKSFGGRVSKDSAEKFENFLQLTWVKLLRRGTGKLILEGFGVGVFGWKFELNLTLGPQLTEPSRVDCGSLDRFSSVRHEI